MKKIGWSVIMVESRKPSVILSEAKDHLATLDPRKKILRFAQDDKAPNASRSRRGSLEASSWG